MDNKSSHPDQGSSAEVMSLSDFAAWGMPELAFVKKVVGEAGWSIHAADGSQMGLAPTRDLAFAAIRQHELAPVSVH